VSLPAQVREVRNLTVRVQPPLPDGGQQLLDGFTSDREAIQREADQKIQARREALVKAFEALQEEYTKAGKLDEAIAIRNYLRAGLPGVDGRTLVREVRRD
jgi:hypothetical protein